MKRPKIVMKPYKVDKEGNLQQEPIYIQFEDKVFQTEDEQIAEFLRSLKNFGYDYREVDEIPQGYGYQGNKPVTRMDNPRPEGASEVAELRGQVGQLTAAVNGVLQLVQGMMDEKNATKIGPAKSIGSTSRSPVTGGPALNPGPAAGLVGANTAAVGTKENPLNEEKQVGNLNEEGSIVTEEAQK